jgi:glycerate kinase
MKIILAPNSFKHALSARAAAFALEHGIRESFPDADCIPFPIGDGGDGTGELIVEALGGTWVDVKAEDPLGRPIDTRFGLVDEGRTAVIEMTYASGIRLLNKDERNPMEASSFGTGQLMVKALDAGVKKIILCMGGSATVDGGLGILNALGLQVRDGNGMRIMKPSGLTKAVSVDLTSMDTRIFETQVQVLCDVQNYLLGEQGAAAVFGPQKGATPQMVIELDRGLARLAELCQGATGKDMTAIHAGGTAGGAAAGLWAFLDAKLLNGIEQYLDLTGFDLHLAGSDILITGEGSLDEQTLQGKGPFGVARRAKAKGLRVIGVAGVIQGEQELSKWFDELICINDEEAPLEVMLKNTAFNLSRVGREIGSKIRAF